jgi:hypothetical protein
VRDNHYTKISTVFVDMIGFSLYLQVEFILTLSDRFKFGINHYASVSADSDTKRQERTLSLSLSLSVILLNSMLPDKSRSPLIVGKPSLTSIKKRIRSIRIL